MTAKAGTCLLHSSNRSSCGTALGVRFFGAKESMAIEDLGLDSDFLREKLYHLRKAAGLERPLQMYGFSKGVALLLRRTD